MVSVQTTEAFFLFKKNRAGQRKFVHDVVAEAPFRTKSSDRVLSLLHSEDQIETFEVGIGGREYVFFKIEKYSTRDGMLVEG